MPVPFNNAASPSNSNSTAASSSVSSPAHNVEVPLRENRLSGGGGRGMTRSSASYGIQQLLQEQVTFYRKGKGDDEEDFFSFFCPSEFVMVIRPAVLAASPGNNFLP